MEFLKFLTLSLDVFLAQKPFCDWQYEKSIEEDLPDPLTIIAFPKNGLEVQCGSKRTITTIFLFAQEDQGFDQSMLDVSLNSKRQEILGLFGDPVKSGEAQMDIVLGEFGPWEQFQIGTNFITFSFEAFDDRIKSITLMTPEVRP